LYPSLTFRPNICISRPTYPLKEVVHRFIKHVNDNKKIIFLFLLVIVLVN
jgi:hypothetical protein